MRIALIADPLDNQYAGPRTVTEEIAAALSQLAPTHDVIFVRPESKCRYPGVQELTVPCKRNIPGAKSFRLFVDIPRKLTKAGVDLVVEPAHFGPFNLPKRIKRVTVIYDLTPVLFPHYHLLTSSVLHRIFLPRIVQQASHIITCSQCSLNDIVNRYPAAAGKTSAIYLGAERAGGNKNGQNSGLQSQVPAPYILCVGTIEPRKNLVGLLAAFQYFKHDTAAPHKLVLVGKLGWKTEEFLAALETHPFREQIVHLGYVDTDQLRALYEHATCLVYPSYYEGFGLPVAEAMYLGTPVVISNSSSLPEVGGDAALYFDPKNPPEMAARLKTVALDEDEQQRRSALCRTQAKKFSWQTFRNSVASLILRVAER